MHHPLFPLRTRRGPPVAARNVWTYVFLRLRRWLLKQQPDKTVFNRFIEN